MRREIAAVKSALKKMNGSLTGAELITTPLGPLYAAASGRGIFLLQFVDESAAGALPVQKGSKLIGGLRHELDRYFKGKLIKFATAVKFETGTEFQKKVWKSLGKIPYGKTFTYQQIAQTVGTPQGFRAVGMANGANPVAILIPCHRVINASGHLGGYAGGISRKLKLLEIEGHEVSPKGQLL